MEREWKDWRRKEGIREAAEGLERARRDWRGKRGIGKGNRGIKDGIEGRERG